MRVGRVGRTEIVISFSVSFFSFRSLHTGAAAGTVDCGARVSAELPHNRSLHRAYVARRCRATAVVAPRGTLPYAAGWFVCTNVVQRSPREILFLFCDSGR